MDIQKSMKGFSSMKKMIAGVLASVLLLGVGITAKADSVTPHFHTYKSVTECYDSYVGTSHPYNGGYCEEIIYKYRAFNKCYVCGHVTNLTYWQKIVHSKCGK